MATIVPYVTFYRANTRNFFSETFPVSGGGDSPRANWFIMQIDTQPWDPYDWIAASRDFRFEQGSYLVANDLDSLRKKIAEYMGSHTMQPNQPLHRDQNGEPWLLGKCNECTGSGRYGFAMTGAYDGVAVFPVGGGGTDSELSKEYVRSWVADKAPQSPVDPPVDLKGYSKADLPATPIPGGGGGGTTIPGGGGGPGGGGVIPPPLPPPPPASQSSGTSPILLAGVAAAAVYWFTRKK